MTSNDGTFKLSTGSLSGEDEMEGHTASVKHVVADEQADAEGHRIKLIALQDDAADELESDEATEDDTEGHRFHGV